MPCGLGVIFIHPLALIIRGTAKGNMHQQTAALVNYVVRRVQEQEGTVNKTKLVKILYLIDLEYYRAFRQTLTGFDWTFYHYGPYAFEVEGILQGMPLGFDEDTVTTAKGRQAYVYRSSEGTDAFEAALKYSQKVVIDSVIDRWALDDLNTVLDYVYFETEPMEGAFRGQRLDFSRVEIRPQQATVSIRHRTDPKLLRQLQDGYRGLLASRARSVRPRVTPPPYDEVYFRAIRALDEEDEVTPNVDTFDEA